MKRFLVIASLLFSMFNLCAQEVIPLYNGAIPGAKTPPAGFKEQSVTGTV